MKKHNIIKKATALAVATAVIFGAGNVASAETQSGSFTVDSGNYIIVYKDSKVKKTNATRTDAKFTCNMSVARGDTLNFVVYNQNDHVVSTHAASFSNTASGTTKAAPYRDGKGLKGNPFYFRCNLDMHSLSKSLKVKYKFIP